MKVWLASVVVITVIITFYLITSAYTVLCSASLSEYVVFQRKHILQVLAWYSHVCSFQDWVNNRKLVKWISKVFSAYFNQSYRVMYESK